MLCSKIKALRTARRQCDALTLLTILTYGSIAWAAYPASIFTWVNMAVCLIIIAPSAVIIRSRISKLIKLLERED